MAPRALIACPDCDLLQREPEPASGQVVTCARCGSLLFRRTPDTVDRTLAFALGAAVLFVIANAFPIVGMTIEGRSNTVSLPGALVALWNQDMQLVAGLVGLTTLLAPCLVLATLLYLLTPLRFGRLPPGVPLILRTLDAIQPWGLVEVFMLGLLVSLVKLEMYARVVPGVALWAFGALLLVFTAMAAAFDPRSIWARIGAAR
jgi:paraquat-inducible protein A